MGRFVQLSAIYNTNPQKQNTLISFKTTFIINFRQERVDNKMYCVVCIMFGIANKNYVKSPDSNSYLGQQSRLENIKVCYWAVPKICKEGRTCFRILGVWGGGGGWWV